MDKKVLCLAPFVSAYKNYLGVSACCEMPTNKNNELYPTLDAYLNSDFYQDLCESMKRFDIESLPRQCKLCLGSAKPHADMYELPYRTELHENVDYDSFRLSLFTIGQSNKCNAACRMCGPDVSDTKNKLFNDLGLVGLPFGTTRLETNPEEDLEIIRKYEGEIKNIVIHGGNPAQFETTPELLDTLLAQKDPVKISFLTNGSFSTMTDGRNLYEVLNGFPKVDIMFSIDSIPEANDYIRDGNKTKRIVKLIKEAREKITDAELTLCVHCTLTNYSVIYFAEFLDWFEKELEPVGVVLSVGLVRYPRMYATGNLPDDVKKEVFYKLRPIMNGKYGDDVKLAMSDMLQIPFNQAEWDKAILQNKMQDEARGVDGSNIFPMFTSDNMIPIKKV